MPPIQHYQVKVNTQNRKQVHVIHLRCTTVYKMLSKLTLNGAKLQYSTVQSCDCVVLTVAGYKRN